MTKRRARNYSQTYTDSQKKKTIFLYHFLHITLVFAGDASSRLFIPIIKQAISAHEHMDTSFLVYSMS